MSLHHAAFVAVLASATLAARLPAQPYDPVRDSPLQLVKAPSDGVGYYRESMRARTLIAEKRDAEAEVVLERLTAQYPRDGAHWLLLAQVRSRLEKYALSAAAYDRAGDILGLRTPTGFIPANGAVNHLKAGNRSAAIALLRRYVFDSKGQFRQSLMDSPGLAPLRSDPEFREIAGAVDTAGLDRTSGRLLDLEYLYQEVERANQDPVLPAEFTKRYQRLRTRVQDLSEEEFVVELNMMLAALRWGHTHLLSGTINGKVHQIPLQFHLFPDGLYIVNASEEHRALIGSKVLSFGNTEAVDALRTMQRMLSVDGDMQYLNDGVYLLRAASYLKGMGIVPAADTVALTIETPKQSPRVVRLVTGSHEGYQKLPPAPGVPAPMYMDSVSQNHWYTALPKHRALYVQVNQMRNDSDQSLPDFGREVWTALSRTSSRHLIVDVRHNSGGATSLYPELLKSIISFARDTTNRLYVLTSRTTYSASSNFITDLERLANPVFVGEPSGECCRLHGDVTAVKLPYTGRRGAISIVTWNLSGDAFDGRREIAPHVPVQQSAADYFAGRDPALEAVLRLIDGR